MGAMRRRRNRRAGLLAVLLVAVAVVGCTSSADHRRRPAAVPATVGPTNQLGPTGDRAAAAPARPNIVFVLTDDLSDNLVRYMPHVLAMQRAGVTLGRYYVVDSLCCPSRSAIMTGEYPHDDGVFTNTGDDGGYATFNRHGNQANTYALALQRSGYRTAMMGKYLNGYAPGFRPPPGWNEWDVAGNGYAEYDYELNQNGTPHHYGHRAQDYLTDVIANKGTAFIRRSVAARRPFAIELATFAPHHPYTPAARDAHSFPGLRAPRTPAFGRLPSDPPPWLAKFPSLTAHNERYIDATFRKRVQSVQAVDRMIGRLEQTLQATGQAADTYFVFSSDNGYHLGEHDLRPGKQTAFETDIHVPLVVTGPQVPAGRTVSQLTTSIDLAPTFETLAHVPPPAAVDGISMAALWHGQTPNDWPNAVLIEHHGPDTTPGDPDFPPKLSGNPPSYEAVRTASALYVEYSDGEREYYDTARDPDELANLAAREPAAVLRPLQRALAAMSTCHGATSCEQAARVR